MRTYTTRRSQTPWTLHWATYTGRCFVVLDDSSVAYGEVTDTHPAEPTMSVLLDNGTTVYPHPRHVWPEAN